MCDSDQQVCLIFSSRKVTTLYEQGKASRQDSESEKLLRKL